MVTSCVHMMDINNNGLAWWLFSLLFITSSICVPMTNKIHTVEIGSIKLEISNDRILNRPCEVSNKTYRHGETFLLDCRTQCTCQNGRYGCSSLCPQESMSPRCRHPRLLEMPGHCCRQWLCDPPPPPRILTNSPKGILQSDILPLSSSSSTLLLSTEPLQNYEEDNRNYIKDRKAGDLMYNQCEPKVTPWTTCTAQCGMGLSHRESNLNALCEQITETRICQERGCEYTNNITNLTSNSLKHHLRKGHECKATNRLYTPIHFRFGPCTSRKHFRPKYCGECTTPGVCCRSQLSTTVRVDFICDFKNEDDSIEKDSEFDVILENVQLGVNLWSKSNVTFKNDNIIKSTRTITVNIQWILKCVCNSFCDNGDSDVVVVTEESSRRDTILHRVHRTAPP